MERRTFAEELRKKYGIELGERVGRGAFGEVYRATSGGGACAIKISLDPIDLSQAWVAQELKGLELVKRVKGHPHIVTLFDVWRVQGYLVTRWELGQQSLADRLKECQNQGLPGIPREELLRYMKQAAVASDFLNEQGIYHRDIKPENLVLFHGYVKLADLGLAKFVGESSGSHSGSGTLGYIPPEALKDRLTRSSDLYALAATYIKLRTGHEPFGSNHIEIGERQKAGRPIQDGLDGGEKEAIRHALAYKPEERPQNAHEWVQLLSRRSSAPPSKARTPVPLLPPSSKLVTKESDNYRRQSLLSGMNRLLQCHETIAKRSRSFWPLVQGMVLGSLLGFWGGAAVGGAMRATFIGWIGGFALCLTVMWLRIRLWKKAAAGAEHNLSITIQELLADFPQECLGWGGFSALCDRELVRDLVVDLETKRMN